MPRITEFREEVAFTFYDTVAAEYLVRGRYAAFGNNNVGNLALTNMHLPGQLSGDASAVVRRVLFGAPKEVFQTWSKCVWELQVAQKLYFQLPLWAPPDSLVPPEELAVRGLELSVLQTPLDWQFHAYHLRSPVCVAPRQNFSVVFNAAGSTPLGEMYVLLEIMTARDVL